MSRHTIVMSPGEIPEIGGFCVIEGDEAKHALRVKRVTEGDSLRLVDGTGTLATGTVKGARRILEVEITDRQTIPPLQPIVEVCSATPKGPRAEKMIDQLAQVGVSLWRPMRTKLGVVDPQGNKLSRMDRIAFEAIKQSGQAHVMRIGEAIDFEEAIQAEPGVEVCMADLGEEVGAFCPSGSHFRLLIGPEGGFLDEERKAAKAAGVQSFSLGTSILRIETAAVAGAWSLINTPGAGR
ncbi:MAG: 16S rRNA (uracil(1498)-N(3))-methyltransferase [Planctomycetota bacterium]